MPGQSPFQRRHLVTPAAFVLAACVHVAASTPAPDPGTDATCTLSVGTPRIVAGQAAFTVHASCPADAERRVVQIELVGNDAAYDDTLRWAQDDVGGGNSTMRTSRTWPCAEDAAGKDEVYVRARFKSKSGGVVRTEAWIKGRSTSGYCR